MEKLLDKVIINNDADEYYMTVDNTLLKDKLNKVLSIIQIDDLDKYVEPVNDELINNIVLRIVVELFIKKVELEDNKPYIVNVSADSVNYRLSITKINADGYTKYMYGLIMY